MSMAGGPGTTAGTAKNNFSTNSHEIQDELSCDIVLEGADAMLSALKMRLAEVQHELTTLQFMSASKSLRQQTQSNDGMPAPYYT